MNPGDFLTGWAVTLTALAAIITALGIIWLKGIRPALRRSQSGIHAVQRVVRALDRLIPFAEEQLRSNGGSTAKDQFDRIDTLVMALNHRLEEHIRDLRAGQSAAIAAAREAKEAALEAKRVGEERYLALDDRLAMLADKGEEG